MNPEQAAPPRTPFFLDTEFIETGHKHPVELVSISLVTLAGHTYYAEISDADLTRADDWVKANVLAQLLGGKFAKPRAQVARELLEFVWAHHDLAAHGSPQFWAYFADYDWVVFCQLYGRMLDLPAGFPMYCLDLKQVMVGRDIARTALPADPNAAHRADADALWARDAYMRLRGLIGTRTDNFTMPPVPFVCGHADCVDNGPSKAG